MAGLDLFQLRLGRAIVGIEDGRTVRAASVTADRGVETLCLRIAPGPAHVIGNEHGHGRRRTLREAVPDLRRVIGRQKRIEEPPLAARVDANACHHLLQVHVGSP